MSFEDTVMLWFTWFMCVFSIMAIIDIVIGMIRASKLSDHQPYTKQGVSNKEKSYLLDEDYEPGGKKCQWGGP